MNIQMQLCGLIVLLLILYFYARYDTVGLYTEKLFWRALCTSILCLVLDILSVVFIVNMDILPGLLVRGECKLYLFSLVFTGYMAFSYACSDAFNISRANKFIGLFGTAVAVDGVVIFLAPVKIFCEDGIVYTYGPACNATYIGALTLILVTLFSVMKKERIMNPKRSKAIKTWMIMWIAAALIQLFNSQILIVGFASAMGMIILFFELENPEASIDRGTGFFNARVFTDYIRQRYNEKADSCIILISLEDAHTNDAHLQPGQTEDVILEVAEFLRHVPEAKKFKTDDKEYALVFNDREAFDRAFAMIDDRFQRSWLDDNNMTTVMLHPYYALIPTGKITRNAEELISLIKYFRMHCMDNPENHIVRIDEGSVEKKRAREHILDEIIDAMNEDRVEVFYQPIYSTDSRKFESAEALVRIRGKDGGIIPPGLFIPVSEETGLIARLGEIVFEKVCRFITQCHPRQYGLEYIEVNLSVVQCEDRLLAQKYINIMEKYQIDPSYINLEITESASIIMKKILLENMSDLIEYGVSFSLDDFGNGQSNLNYIVEMPVQIVKFDKDITQSYFENDKARYVLQAAADMVQGLKLRVVAEGVETAEQLRELERLGIDYIQGYLFSKPVEANQFIEFLKTKNV